MILLLLKNNGSDCYINASLQCILNNKDFLNFIYANRTLIQKYQFDANIDTFPLSKSEVAKGISMIKSLAILLEKLYNPGYNGNTIDKTGFDPCKITDFDIATLQTATIDFNFLKKIILSKFGDGDTMFTGQQDAHEFISKFLSCLCAGFSHMNMVINDETQRDILDNKYIIEYMKRSKSGKYDKYNIISQQFGGSTIDYIECTLCGYVAEREVMYDILNITLQIEDNVGVQETIDEHFGFDDMVDNIKLTCDKCNQKYLPVKTTLPNCVPKTLICTLKRFNDNGTKKKANVPICEILNFKVDNNVFKYTLSSCIYHIGSTIQSGHYVSLVKKSNQKWYIFDDDTYREYANIDQKSINNVDSYILFFELN